ncbi:MAG: response regulator [Gemmatimonadales bacterium]|nr:response regulator [Gemmatimonadales bacterium]
MDRTPSYEGLEKRIQELEQAESDCERAAKDLQEREQQYRTIMEASVQGIYQVDVNGCIIVANAKTAELTGYSIDELDGLSLDTLFPTSKAKTISDDNVARLISGESIVGENTLTRKNGCLIETYFSCVPVLDESGVYTGFVGSILDNTGRKKAEEEREKLRQQLFQAQKLESVGRLAGGVAHDFNNILSIILGYTEMILKDMDEVDPLFFCMHEIQQAAKRSTNLTKQLLAFARKQTIAPKVLDLNETIEGMLTMLRRLIGEDIDLSWRPRVDLWPVKADTSQIDQLLANLCVNARDSIQGVGKITIETDNVNFDEEYCRSREGYRLGDYVMTGVSDNGFGMDRETQDNIFEPFFTTKDAGQGTGLGLATVYGIVKQNNGFINVYSEPGEGTTFKIYIPRHTEALMPAQKKDSVAETKKGDETILLVEDEKAILRMTVMMLERLGYTVLSASSPGEAVKIEKSHSGKIDLLMTDVVMPGMNGRDLSRKLFQTIPDLKCLFMSGYTANVIAHRGVLDEGVQFIQKPFSLHDLAAKIREVLEQAKGH